jgi:hypothetical protein
MKNFRVPKGNYRCFTTDSLPQEYPGQLFGLQLKGLDAQEGVN